MTSVVEGPWRADVRTLLGEWTPGVVITRDEPPDTLTCLLPGAPASDARPRTDPLMLRVPTSADAVPAVQREARLLVDLRRRRLGPIERTIPRHVGVHQLDGLPVTLASVVPGRPMSVDYDHRFHVARPDLVRRDFRLAGAWLESFQEESAAATSRTTWASEVLESLHERLVRDPHGAAALAILGSSAQQLDGHFLQRTAVHGDFWHGNLLLGEDEVSGVVNWTWGEAEGWPLRDLVRFVLRYSELLVQHTRAGRRVPGHPGLRRAGLRRVGTAPGISYGLLGAGWYPRVVRAHLRDGLAGMGFPPELWYHAALVGIGEMAATSRDDRRTSELVALLAGLPA
jgi:hypothetical protein